MRVGRRPQQRRASTTASAGEPMQRRVLIIVENLPVPVRPARLAGSDARSRDAGYAVTHHLPDRQGLRGALRGCSTASTSIAIRCRPKPPARSATCASTRPRCSGNSCSPCRVLRRRGFDVIHACNPPDLIFLVGGFFKLFCGKRFIFDHHDINPELYEAKFGRRDLFYRLMLWLERLTFRTADVSIATNESYRRIALERGAHAIRPRCSSCAAGRSLERLKIVPAVEALKRGRRYLVGYVGVMGKQEGIDYLLRAARAHRAHARPARRAVRPRRRRHLARGDARARARARHRGLRHLHRAGCPTPSCSPCSTPPTSA